MTQLVHCHTFTLAEAVQALLPEIADCEGWELRVSGDVVVVDVVEPAGVAPTLEEVCDLPSNEAQKINTDPARDLKGGPLARRAAMMCSEKGFWTFAEVGSAEEAADFIRRKCGVESRALLDHSTDAAATFDQIDRQYRLWLEGYD